MADFTPQAVRVPSGIVETPVRQFMERVAALFMAVRRGDSINMRVTPGAFTDSGIYIEGELTGGISSGTTATVTIDGTDYTVNSKSIRAGMSLPSNTEFGAIWNGIDYTIIWANKCEV